MPPRFYTSPYKNALATPAKSFRVSQKEGWWSEIPVSTSAPSDSSDLIKATEDYWIAQGSSSGSLVLHSYDDYGKMGGKVPMMNTGLRTVQSFEVSPFDDLLAVGSDNGQINIFDLPPLASFCSDPASSLSPSPLLSLSTPSAKPIDTLSFHPTSSGLLLASSAQTLSVYDLESGSTSPVYEIDGGTHTWSAQWSGDGKYVSSTGKDGKLRLWDVRTDSKNIVAETLAHSGLKPSRHVHLPNSSQILTTGFSRTRDREYSLFDGRMLGTPIKTKRVDTGTGVLVPLVDGERGIVYLIGRGDMSLRWIEVGGPAIFTEGSTPFPGQIAGAALVPPQNLDLMKAEINRLVVLTQDAVVPVPVNVPRRQYIDFHSDLYPEVSTRVPAQTAKEWREGGDKNVETYKPDPLIPFKKATRQTTTATSSNGAPLITTPKKETSSTEKTVEVRETKKETQPTLQAQAQVSSPSSQSLATPQARSESVEPPSEQTAALSIDDEKKPAPAQSPVSTPQSLASPAQPSTPSVKESPPPPTNKSVSTPQLTSTSSNEPFNPGWSRSFLLGKTPLKPDYYDVHSLSVTMSADVELLKANSSFFFHPLSGPGGRLALHPIEKKGRLPVNLPALVCGSTITGFELDPFDQRKVFVACEDDQVRMFRVPEEGVEEEYGETEGVLKDEGMTKITEIRHHPAAKNVLLTVSDDRGHPKARIWDTQSSKLLLSAELPAGGIHSAAWSPDGTRIAFSTKQKQLIILDPRNPVSLVSCAAHESLRPSIVTWASDTHVVSTGFTRSSSRELILYKLTSGKVSPVGKQLLDVSPALLRPFVDLDTKILLCYARGERSCKAFEINFDKSSFGKLPPFDHSTLQAGFAFYPKTRSEVREVEVVKALRLTQGTVEKVSFTVPRSKTEFFQDDIFIPTRNTEKPSMTAKEWLEGKNTPLEIVDLRPEGMKPLSQAPAPKKIVSTRSKIKDDGLTDSQRENDYMDRLYQSAQDEKEDSDDEPQIGRSRVGAPEDDEDW
ncbi:uncharacterized protein JCM6883_001960 [Sporobolomyces salmoneus]|uniref:uncharacterized protein n=1 Tax=Sporobolomyces salmoneus TaxID=183962 RepID=UPI0031724BC8